MNHMRRLQKAGGLFQYIPFTSFPIPLKVIQQLFFLFMDVSAFLHKNEKKRQQEKD
jgi:hypothetical protein